MCPQVTFWVVWASERCETLNSRHFVNFAAVVLQVGLFELHPHSLAGHIQTACSLCSEDCMWGFAHVCSLGNVVLFFTRHLWLFFEVFSQTPFLTVVKILIQDVFSARMRSHDLLWNMFVSSVWQNYNECLAFWSGKPCPFVSCKNIGTCLKHMPEIFQGNNLTSWFKLHASHHFSTIFARNISRDPLWHNTS